MGLCESNYWFLFWMVCAFQAIVAFMAKYTFAWIFGGAVGVGIAWSARRIKQRIYRIPIGRTPDGRHFSLEFEDMENE